jgi:hypothetical protein
MPLATVPVCTMIHESLTGGPYVPWARSKVRSIPIQSIQPGAIQILKNAPQAKPTTTGTYRCLSTLLTPFSASHHVHCTRSRRGIDKKGPHPANEARSNHNQGRSCLPNYRLVPHCPTPPPGEEFLAAGRDTKPQAHYQLTTSRCAGLGGQYMRCEGKSNAWP